ncbi:ABC-type Fe3+ transport system [Diplocarpon rosae]|nr:ABC-type Fe3+ transport system [Diplocarpon rosae]
MFFFPALALALALAARLGSAASALTNLTEETRTLDELHQAALAEGGLVTLWHGGDEPGQQNFLKSAFEARFPGMTLNLTVDLSKHHDVKLDQQIADHDIYVDSIILQTLNDYPRWKDEGVLLQYKPAGFSQIYADFKDSDAYYAGLYIIAALAGLPPPKEYTDFLKPEFKDKLVLTYPNDDDAVLYQFHLILEQYGLAWFDQLLAQNPRWVRGTSTTATVLRQNSTWIATFTNSLRPSAGGVLNATYPTEGKFVSWPQTGAILKDAPHPEGAKLLHNFLLSPEHQQTRGSWSTRADIEPPAGFPKIVDIASTEPAKFAEFMRDRGAVERLRFFFETKIGTAQGLSPLSDGL